MGAAVAVGISEQEYLTNPEYEHCEYIDGEVEAAIPIARYLRGSER